MTKNLLIIFITIFIFSNNSGENIKEVNIYIRCHDAKVPILATTDNYLKEKLFNYIFKLDGLELGVVSDNYNQFIEYLTDNSIINNNVNRYINSCVVFKYSFSRKIIVYFDNQGNYYFNGDWYEPDYYLYVNLFKFFSDELIPNNVLKNFENNLIDKRP